VYTRVQKNQPAKVVVMPLRVGAPGGFSGAGAVRTPQTLDGPMVTGPILTGPAANQPAARPTSQQTATKGAPAKTAQAAAECAPSRSASVQSVPQK
jgi:hypothetical protein